MDTLKNLFPLSWKYTKDTSNLVVGIIVYIVAAIIAGVVIALGALIVGWLPAIGGLICAILGIIGGVIELYVIIGIVLQLLVYFKVIKD